MKALTICQPYAHLIIRGEKRVENREWPTRYRGPLLIHAGKSRSWLTEEDGTHFADGRARKIDVDEETGEPFAFGAIVGIATLADVLHIDRIERGEYDARYPWLREHAHTSGTWCWVLGDDVARFAQPIPYRGQLGLFEVAEPLPHAAGACPC